MPRASVVIPAYNEGAVIDRCLSSMSDVGDIAIVVAANGCTDDTAERARRHGVQVVEVQRASKIAALNAGDEVAGDVFPRVYLDADVDLEPGALDALVRELATAAGPAVGMPRLRVDLEKSSRLVRSFYWIYTRLPYLSDGLVGAGCYAVNRAGRGRWDVFPEIVADDLFVQGLFHRSERLTVSAALTAHAPRTVQGLLKVRTRTYLGNRQAQAAGMAGTMASTASGSVAALARLVARRPWRLPDAIVYAVVNVLARRRASGSDATSPWLTDDTSRTG